MLAALVVSASCGGPSVPAEPRSGSALSPRTEGAPLPAIGSSFEDRPLTEEERAPMDHSAHSGGATGDARGEGDAGIGRSEDAAVAADAGSAPPRERAVDAGSGGHHGGHGGHPHAR